MSLKDLKSKLNAQVESAEKVRAQRVAEMKKQSEAVDRELPRLVHDLFTRIKSALDEVETLHVTEEEMNFVGDSNFRTSKLIIHFGGQLRIAFIPDPFGGLKIEVPRHVSVPFSDLRLTSEGDSPERWFLAVQKSSPQHTELTELTDDLLNELLESVLSI